tara:strand:- start:837 stop:2330 length:1494 start_codon:yes stop_codon:yes gene_type:complete
MKVQEVRGVLLHIKKTPTGALAGLQELADGLGCSPPADVVRDSRVLRSLRQLFASRGGAQVYSRAAVLFARKLHREWNNVARQELNLPPRAPFEAVGRWWTLLDCQFRNAGGVCPESCGHTHKLLNCLQDDGYVVIDSNCPEEIETLTKKYLEGMKHYPEWKKTLDVPQQACAGGFAGSATISGFFSKEARALMAKLHSLLTNRDGTGLFDAAGTGTFFDFKCLMPDRMRVQGPNTTGKKSFYGGKTTAEAWHKDLSETPGTGTPTAVIFGGWFNASPYAQVFTCEPKSHKTEHPPGRGGFAKITAWQGVAKKVLVPPGKGIVFYESITHCVTAASFPGTAARYQWAVHCDNNIGNDVNPVQKREALTTQQFLPNLKSGQSQVMAPGLYRCNHPHKLIQLAAQLKDEYTTDLVISSGKNCVPKMTQSFTDVGLTEDRWIWNEAKKTVTIVNGGPGRLALSLEGSRKANRFVATPLESAVAHEKLTDAEIEQYFLHPF